MAHLSVLVKFMFVMYMIANRTILVNILIAMMDHTHNLIIKYEEKAWRQEVSVNVRARTFGPQLARIIMVLERNLHPADLARFHNDYSEAITVDTSVVGNQGGANKNGQKVQVCDVHCAHPLHAISRRQSKNVVCSSSPDHGTHGRNRRSGHCVIGM